MAASRRGNQARVGGQDLVARVQRVWGESPFYQARLNGPAPDRLYHQPTDPRTPDRALAESLFRGRLAIGAESVDCEGEVERIWDLVVASGPLHSFLHDFSWLRHAGAVGEAGLRPARRLIRAWLDRCERWSPDAWTPYLTGERLTQLCCHAPLALRGEDALWRSRLLSSMARQTRHLARVCHRAETGYERLMTAAGLALAGLCLPGCEEQAERGLELLRRELRLQIRPDGGHISRNPSQQLAIVIRLQMVLKALEARRMPVPGFLRHTVGRMAANALFFRCGDGALAVFNGGYEDDPKSVLAVRQALDDDTVPQGFARHSGFQRLEAARAVVIADVSTGRGPGRFDGAASVHFSSGRGRIVVNCGNGAHLPGEWGRALRQAAAHSTLSSDPPLALFSGGAIAHRRAEDIRGQFLEIERRATVETPDCPRHLRRLYLSAGGDDLRGEDVIFHPPEALARAWRIRFHLHPGVKASLARDGRSVILALPAREGWRFRTDAPVLRLEKSVYCGAGGLPAATEQIVLAPDGLEVGDREAIVVKWAFRRLDGAWSAEGG
ncbi:MAG: heparinase II/III family protein [Amphiplicatus sp.]